MKKSIFLLVCLWVFSINEATAECQPAVDPSNPGFCASFAEAAKCYCNARVGNMMGLTMCSSVKTIYNNMIMYYGSVDKACIDQKNTSPEACKINWNCYIDPGTGTFSGIYTQDTVTKYCSGTGRACERK